MDMIEFVKKNARYFAAGALFVIIVLVLVKFSNSKDAQNVPNEEIAVTEQQQVSEVIEEYQEDAIPAVNELIQNYFTAYAAGDIAALQAIADPITENEQSYITLISQQVEQYQNIVCYTKSGLDSSSYLVSASVDVKFAGADTPAPGLYFFYVRTREDGSLYIDNLYSQYNLSRQEMALDTSVRNLITNFYNSDDVIAQQNEVQQRYEEALAADENLSSLCAETIPSIITQWRETMIADAQQNEGETTESAPEEAAPEVPQEEEPPIQETPIEETTQPEQSLPETISETVYATDKVNVRAGADTSAEKLGSVSMGTALTRTGTEGDWSIIDYNGTVGYIKSEYLSLSALEEAAAPDGIAQGTVVTLSDTINVRSSMSETADKVGVAYKGEKLKVVMSYAEGWTKVNWKDQIGYVKTELLK